MKKIRTWFVLCMVCSLLLAGCINENSDENVQENTEHGTETFEIQSEVNGTIEDDSIPGADTLSAGKCLEWDERRVVIPEVEQEYEIWFFADSHIIIPDDSASEEVQAYAAERLSVFTNEKGVESSQILTEFIAFANDQKPDMVLFGGDILDFPSEANIAFLKEELEKLMVPYVYVMGNHDWTFPWEYMTPEGAEKYRPLYDEVMYGNLIPESVEGEKDEKSEADVALDVVNISGNSYSCVVELEDLVILAVDDSSNQVAAEAAEYIEYAYETDKPVVLMQHVPFSTEKLITEAKNYWGNPVTIGMQVHGGIAPNDVSADLFGKVRDDDSNIRVVLAGHIHFPYEERISAQTVEIITDAAFKGKATKMHIEWE